jgi:hypothetical protein
MSELFVYDVINLDYGFLKTFLESTKDASPEERAKLLEGDRVSNKSNSLSMTYSSGSHGFFWCAGHLK